MAFNDNLVTLRKKAGLSQEQLAEILNVSRQAVSKWESGQSEPDIAKLVQISDIFEVPVDQILKTIHPYKRKEAEESHFYTILIFIALAILWFTGLILIIVNAFFNNGAFQVYIWNISLFFMLIPPIVFICMLVKHKRSERKMNKKK